MLRRVLPWLAVVALVGIAIATAGWGDRTSRLPPTPTQTPTSAPHRPAPTSVSASEALSLVRNVSLRRRDLPAGFGPDLVSQGRLLPGPPSLRLCGASFRSEDFRLARHRAAFAFAGTGRRIVHEVVVYEHGYADRAMAELRAAAPRCTRPVVPDATEQPGTLALRVSSRRGAAAPYELVVERRGDAVSLLRLTGPASATRHLALDLARLLSLRLGSQLPDA